jgi:uncharacterized protein (DUF2147 family)
MEAQDMIGNQDRLRGGAPLASAVLSALLSLFAPGLAFATTPVPAGVWLWDDGRAAVEFHPCGKALCGRIVWVTQEAARNAGPLLDLKNPNPALRGRRICGLDYIMGVTKTADGDWKKGRVYDFNGGATYDLDIDSVDADQVKMRGYKGIRMMGATLTLVRAKSELPACKP